jgi:hypothetical protein
VLTLQKGFAITKQSKFRDQGVAIVIEVPVGRKIFLDESIEWYDWFNLDFDRGRYSRNTVYDKRTYSIGVGKPYIMTTSGLERSDKEAQRMEEGGGIDVTDQQSKEELKKEIEEQQKELERKKKELQKADSTYKYKPSAAIDDARDNAGDDGAPSTNQPQARKNTKTANHFIIGDIMMMRFGS